VRSLDNRRGSGVVVFVTVVALLVMTLLMMTMATVCGECARSDNRQHNRHEQNSHELSHTNSPCLECHTSEVSISVRHPHGTTAANASCNTVIPAWFRSI
jgi:hypothetical protein